MASAEEFFQRGREFDSQGQSQEAIAEYTRAIQLDSNYVEAYFYRSNLLALEGQPQRQLRMQRELRLSLNPKENHNGQRQCGNTKKLFGKAFETVNFDKIASIC